MIDQNRLRQKKKSDLLSNAMLLKSGERTFGVLTKIDLMDKGTDAVDVSNMCYSECFITVDNSLE